MLVSLNLSLILFLRGISYDRTLRGMRMKKRTTDSFVISKLLGKRKIVFGSLQVNMEEKSSTVGLL